MSMKAKKILIKAKRQVFSEMIGNNPSTFHGEGYDFSELREYQIGDDIKFIDWNITAKMQKPYVKIFKEERELNVTVVSMMGGSLYFGSKKFKQETVAEVVALLGLSVVKNGDLFTHLMIQEESKDIAKPSKREFSVHKAVEELLGCELLERKSDYANLSKILMRQIKKKSLIIIVGDFFEIPDLSVLSKKHEVLAVIVRDKIEEHPPALGFSVLKDPQSGASLEGDFGSARMNTYAKKVRQHDRKLYEALKKAQVRFTKVYTHDHAYVPLRRLFGAL